MILFGDPIGDHQDLPGPCTVCNPDDVGVWTYNISQLVFDYITTVGKVERCLPCESF